MNVMGFSMIQDASSPQWKSRGLSKKTPRDAIATVAGRQRLGSPRWWAAVVAAWNKSTHRHHLARLGTIRFAVTNTNVPSIQVEWDDSGRASIVDDVDTATSSFSASEEDWYAFVNGEIRAIRAVFEGYIRYDGPIDRILPYAKNFDFLAKVAKRAHAVSIKSARRTHPLKTSLSAILLLFSMIPRQSVAQKEITPKRVESREEIIRRGEYLAQIGVCEACHTPPAVPAKTPTAENDIARERRFRTDPDWVKYLDSTRRMAGGVPFLLRLSKDSSGVVYSRNITPDADTGIGKWTDDQLVEVIRSGKRPDGSSLLLFAPHSFFNNLALRDARAIVAFLRTLKPINSPIPERQLPFPAQAATEVTSLVEAPSGRSIERAKYLTAAVVGCRECHSHTENGKLQDFTGGDVADSNIGVFRLGPDLALRPEERGFSAFPYPGYAVLYGPNLTRFGIGGDLSKIPDKEIVRAIRRGIGTGTDGDGRPDELEHVMLWQFYKRMSDDDALSIAQYLKTLKYVPHPVDDIEFFGEDWQAAFKKVYHEAPSDHDFQLFGKTIKK